MEVEEGREKILATGSGSGGEERADSSKWKWRRGGGLDIPLTVISNR